MPNWIDEAREKVSRENEIERQRIAAIEQAELQEFNRKHTIFHSCTSIIKDEIEIKIKDVRNQGLIVEDPTENYLVSCGKHNEFDKKFFCRVHRKNEGNHEDYFEWDCYHPWGYTWNVLANKAVFPIFLTVGIVDNKYYCFLSCANGSMESVAVIEERIKNWLYLVCKNN